MLDIQLGRRNLSPIQRIAIAEKLGNPNPMKLGRCIKELERIYGIKQGGHGSNQYVQNSNNFKSAKTQEDLAKELGITVQSINNYKKLTKMIPELSDLVDTGIISQIPTNILTMYIKSNNINI